MQLLQKQKWVSDVLPQRHEDTKGKKEIKEPWCLGVLVAKERGKKNER